MINALATVPLFARVTGTGPHLLVLHGVFGSGDNWATFVKPWAEQRTTHLLDLRNHGKSPHSDGMSYAELAADVAAYINTHNLGAVEVIGHSMGGKTAMQVAASYPAIVSKLAVIDIAPRAYPLHHQKYLAGFEALDLPTLTNRAQAEERMGQFVDDVMVRQFLLKNLVRNEEGGFSLRLNLQAVASGIGNVGTALPADAQITCPLLFVGGGLSHYILPADEADIQARFPQAHIEMIPNSGHWIHVDNAALLAQILQKFFAIAI